MIEKNCIKISVFKQCEMLSVPRSSYYNFSKAFTSKDMIVIDLIASLYNKKPTYGSRRIQEVLKRQGHSINRKKIQRLMRIMKIQGVCPKPNLSIVRQDHEKYPYIARLHPIIQINQVWSADITYLKTKFGYVYLVAIIDWHSRFVLSWSISNNMGEEFCIEALGKALTKGVPEIFNTDQGSQFTCKAFIAILLKNCIKPSMDGKGRATDNAAIERFWRSVKWEEVYLYEPQTYQELRQMIEIYIKFYNYERPHQSLKYKTPSEIHFDLEKKLFDSDFNPIYTEKELKYLTTW